MAAQSAADVRQKSNERHRRWRRNQYLNGTRRTRLDYAWDEASDEIRNLLVTRRVMPWVNMRDKGSD